MLLPYCGYMLLPVVVLGQTRGELCARPLRAFAATDFLAKARIRRDFELEQSRAVVELRRAGRGRAAHDHAGQAGHSGDPGRYRLPVPGNLSLRRRPHRAPVAESQGLPSAGRHRVDGSASRQAVGGRRRRHPALQPAAKGRTDAARPARTRRAHLDRRSAPHEFVRCAAVADQGMAIGTAKFGGEIDQRGARRRPFDCRRDTWPAS